MAKSIGFEYSPEDPPADASAEEVARWALQELQKASIVINNLAGGASGALAVAPKKPFNGMIRMADGVNWNPGSGRGYYGFDETSGTWLPLGVIAP